MRVKRFSVGLVAAVTAGLVVALPPAGPAEAGGALAGNLIYLAGNNEGLVKVYNAAGERVRAFDTTMNGGDRLVTGDVDGDGVEEVIVAGNATGGISVYQDTGEETEPFAAFFNSGDKLATGDLDGDGVDEIIVAGDEDGGIEIYRGDGTDVATFDTGFDEGDHLFAGDIDGNGVEEIIQVGDETGHVVVRDLSGTPIYDFESHHNDGDTAAVGDVDGNGTVEVLVAGDQSHKVDAFDKEGNYVNTFDTSYTGGDGLAAGDIDYDGRDEVLVADSNSGRVNMYHGETGGGAGSIFGTGFDDGDFIATGGSPDVDTDGIPNNVERFGIRAADGSVHLDLRALGADPCRPTVLVQTDHMVDGTRSLLPSTEVLNWVRIAFEGSGRVNNTQCPYLDAGFQPGVSLILLPGTEIPHRKNFTASKSQAYADLSDLRDGTNNNGQNPGGPVRLAPERRPYVHYAVFVDTLINGDNVIGLAPGKGKDFIVATNGSGDFLQASTFMHELGHSLGLGHGGFEDGNFKPNYISIMNYAFPIDLRLNNPPAHAIGPELDFSHGLRPDLDQAQANEKNGVFDDVYRTAYFDPSGSQRTGPGNGPLNFDGDAVPDEPSVVADVNGDLGGLCITAGSDGVLDTTQTGGDDKRVTLNATEVDTLPVIHAGDNYVCETEVKRTTQGKAQDVVDNPIGANLRVLKDHDDWGNLDFRRPRLTLDQERVAYTPHELPLSTLNAIQSRWDQQRFPDRTLNFGTPPAGTQHGISTVATDAQRVYVTHYWSSIAEPKKGPADSELIVLDRATLTEIKRIKTGHQPRSVAVNPVNGKIYVGNHGQFSYNVMVIDPVSLTVVATVPIGAGPADIAVHRRTNKVYVSNWYTGLHIIDGTSDALIGTVQMGVGATGMAIDEGADKAYVAMNNRSFEPFVNGLGVVDLKPATPVLLPTVPIGPGLTQPRDVAVDPTTNRIFVANVGGGGVQPGVAVLDRTTMAAVTYVVTPGQVQGIAADPASRLVFAGADNGIVTLNSATLAKERFMPLTAQGPLNVAASGREIHVGNRNGQLLRLSYGSGQPA